MARPLRIQYPNAWYHVMNKARKGQNAFLVKEDQLAFVYLLRDTSAMFNLNIAAWCLMDTHYHLLVQTPDANLARCMRHINGVYTQRYNARHTCDGTLFRGRYKSILVDADNYLLQLVRYIHRNPLRAGLVDNLSQYNWSSHKAYLSKSDKWDWVYKDFILEMLAASRSVQLKKYKHFVNIRDSAEVCAYFERKSLPSIIGETSFIDWVKETFFKGKIDRSIPRTKSLAPSINSIRKVVSEYYQIDEEMINLVHRGKKNLPRDVAMYFMRAVGREPLLSIGEAMGIKKYSSVSSAVYRVKNRLATDKQLRRDIHLIAKILTRGQTET